MDDADSTYAKNGDGDPDGDEIEIEPLPEPPPPPDTAKLVPTAGAIAPDGLTVTMPSGAQFPVLTPDEAALLVDRIHRYNADNRFVNISDLSDLDRLLINEMFVFRWQFWCSTGTDYAGDDGISESTLRKNIKEYSTEIRQQKDQLGIDRTSRDRAKGEESVAEFLLTLRQRAKEFGIHRDMQVAKLYELGNQLLGLLTFHDNADDEERRELGITREDLFEWIRTKYRPEFEAIDVAFRLNQKMWVRTL